MWQYAAILVFPGLMAYAAASDLLTMTISNWISVLLVAVFLLLAPASGLGSSEILIHHLSCGISVLILTFVLFSFGWIGGGDAKVTAATAVWIGWGNLEDYGIVASMFGGALTLAVLVCRQHPLPLRLAGAPWAERLHEAHNGVPYGIALAAAGLVIYPQTPLWAAIAGA